MGNRLSKIVTRTGDNGTTALADGHRISKNSLIIHLIGDIDELNSHVGMAIALLNTELAADNVYCQDLLKIQHLLFDMGGELAFPTHSTLSSATIEYLEERIHFYNHALQPLKEFILPGGAMYSAQLHLCRTVSRRVERQMVAVIEHSASTAELNPYFLLFLNRLSDFFFVINRALHAYLNTPEVYWSNHSKRHT